MLLPGAGDAEEQSAPALDPQRFRELHAALQVDPATEAWRSAGWRTSLGAARIEAAAAGRPLFLWAMNGHPLGCT